MTNFSTTKNSGSYSSYIYLSPHEFQSQFYISHYAKGLNFIKSYFSDIFPIPQRYIFKMKE